MGDVLLAANHNDRVSSRDQVAGSADGDFSVFWLRDSLALYRSFSLRVMRSYRPQLFHEVFVHVVRGRREISELLAVIESTSEARVIFIA
jgi:hypothetical protein